MAQFRYTAKSMNGKTRRGTMEVPNETVLQQNLKEQGLFLIQASYPHSWNPVSHW